MFVCVLVCPTGHKFLPKQSCCIKHDFNFIMLHFISKPREILQSYARIVFTSILFLKHLPLMKRYCFDYMYIFLF